MKKKKFFIFIIVALILSMSMTIFAATKTVYTCPDCGESSKNASDIYRVNQKRNGNNYSASIECKHCGYVTDDVSEFKEEVEIEEGEDEDEGGIKGIFNKLKKLLEFIISIPLEIINALLAMIGLVIYGIARALYSFLGNDFITNFINFSLNFESIGGNVGNIVSNIKGLLTGLSFSLIVLFVLKNILLNYILWRGNPNENPLEIIISIAMCTALIVGFDEIYSLIHGVLSPLINSINGGESVSFDEIPTMLLNLATEQASSNDSLNFEYFKQALTHTDGFFRLLISEIFAIYLFIKFFQAMISAMKSGFELLALRIAAPLACLSLLNNNVGGFSSYLKELIKRFFGIMIRVAAINISIILLASVSSSGELFITICGTLACIGIVENPGQILSGFTAGGLGGNELSQASHSGASAISAGKIAIGKIASTFKGGGG